MKYEITDLGLSILWSECHFYIFCEQGLTNFISIKNECNNQNVKFILERVSCFYLMSNATISWTLKPGHVSEKSHQNIYLEEKMIGGLINSFWYESLLDQ